MQPEIIKKRLLESCHQIIDERISRIEDNLKSVQKSRNNETKSSAGDKYETGRAMLQIEEDNYLKQLQQVIFQRDQLRQIDPVRKKNHVDRGSLVVTSNGSYYICIGLGVVSVEGENYFCVSPASPVGQQLIGKQPGYQFQLNGNTIEIREIY